MSTPHRMKQVFYTFVMLSAWMVGCGSSEDDTAEDSAELESRGYQPAPIWKTQPVENALPQCVGYSDPAVCVCPAGFISFAGLCVRDDVPYDECNSAADCTLTRGPASACHAWQCTSAEHGYDACVPYPLSGGQACTKPGGGAGTCAPAPWQGDCI